MVKLSDYGIRGPWRMADCDQCGKRRSCLISRVPLGYDDWEEFAECVPCLVKDIRAAEKSGERMVMQG